MNSTVGSGMYYKNVNVCLQCWSFKKQNKLFKKDWENSGHFPGLQILFIFLGLFVGVPVNFVCAVWTPPLLLNVFNGQLKQNMSFWILNFYLLHMVEEEAGVNIIWKAHTLLQKCLFQMEKLFPRIIYFFLLLL